MGTVEQDLARHEREQDEAEAEALALELAREEIRSEISDVDLFELEDLAKRRVQEWRNEAEISRAEAILEDRLLKV